MKIMEFQLSGTFYWFWKEHIFFGTNTICPYNRQFDKLSKEILKGNKSIYKLLPLNPPPAK